MRLYKYLNNLIVHYVNEAQCSMGLSLIPIINFIIRFTYYTFKIAI